MKNSELNSTPDSNRTIRASPFERHDLVNSFAWRGYNF